MSALQNGFTPKMRGLPARRTSLVAALDIGTSKIACLIARLKPGEGNDVLPGRSHSVEIIGASHIQSRGIKAGAVADLNEVELAARHAVAMAEQSANVQIVSVLMSVSAGRMMSELVEAAADIDGHAIAASDIARIMNAAARHTTHDGRAVLHAHAVSHNVDGVRGIRDPEGMVARHYSADMNVVTIDDSVAQNLIRAVERSHLTVEAMVAAPYAAALSVLTDDEPDLGAAVIDMGAGTTTLACYSAGRFVHASGFAVGGQHVTMDLARGLRACIADAERIKTLYGTVLAGGSDARDLVNVPQAGDHEHEPPQIVSRATITNIIRHRVEEIFEMARDRLAGPPLAAEPKARVVLTGGAAQLTGIADLAARVLGREVRVGRPLGIARLPDAYKSPGFAAATGLLVYPQIAHLEHFEPRQTRHRMTGTDSYFGKVGRWLSDSF